MLIGFCTNIFINTEWFGDLCVMWMIKLYCEKLIPSYSPMLIFLYFSNCRIFVTFKPQHLRYYTGISTKKTLTQLWIIRWAAQTWTLWKSDKTKIAIERKLWLFGYCQKSCRSHSKQTTSCQMTKAHLALVRWEPNSHKMLCVVGNKKYSTHATSVVKYGGGNIMLWECISSKGTEKLVKIGGEMDGGKHAKQSWKKKKAVRSQKDLEMWFTFLQDINPKH